jgi:hypothetical protein
MSLDNCLEMQAEDAEDEAAVLRDLVEVREALQEGFEDCGEDPDCLWAEALKKLDRSVTTLTTLFGDFVSTAQATTQAISDLETALAEADFDGSASDEEYHGD